MKHSPLLLRSTTLVSCTVWLLAIPVAAQEPPTVPALPPMEPPPAIAPTPPDFAVPPPPVEPPPPEPPKSDLGGINLGVWGRSDVTLSNGEKLNDIGSTGLAELHTSGKLHEYFAFTANLVAGYGGDDGISGTAGLMDAILQFEPHDLFHLWLGRNLVPVDRSNFSGPWFMAPWFYPGFGFVDGQVGAPHEGPSGRNDGVTAWGFHAEDSFSIKYHIGVYDLHARNESPLISGRLTLSLLSPEPGFYNNSTYYGKDLLALGGGFQFKKHGSTAALFGAPEVTSDYTELNVDLLFEKKLGESVLDLEGAFYKFNGDYERTDAAWFALASLLLPGGRIQPLVRVQQALPAYKQLDETSTLVDAQIGYVLNAFATRFAAGFRYGKAGDVEGKTVFFGAQFEK